MPTKSKVKLIPTKSDGKVELGFTVRFDAEDPIAAEIYKATGVFLRSIMTDDELREFKRQMDLEQGKLRTKRKAVKK